MNKTLWVSVDFMGEEIASGYLTFTTALTKELIKQRCIVFAVEASGLNLDPVTTICRITREVSRGKYSDILDVQAIQNMEEIKIKLIVLHNMNMMSLSSPSGRSSLEELAEASSGIEDESEHNESDVIHHQQRFSSKSPRLAIEVDASPSAASISADQSTSQPLIKREPYQDGTGSAASAVELVVAEGDGETDGETRPAEKTGGERDDGAKDGTEDGLEPENASSTGVEPAISAVQNFQAATDDQKAGDDQLNSVEEYMKKELDNISASAERMLDGMMLANTTGTNTAGASDDPDTLKRQQEQLLAIQQSGGSSVTCEISVGGDIFCPASSSHSGSTSGNPHSSATDGLSITDRQLQSPSASVAYSSAASGKGMLSPTSATMKIKMETAADAGLANGDTSQGFQARLHRYRFEPSDTYDVRTIIQAANGGKACIESLDLTKTSEDLDAYVRKFVTRVGGEWLLNNSAVPLFPSVIERARLAHSIVATFPCFNDVTKILGYENLFDPKNHTGSIQRWINNKKYRMKQKDFLKSLGPSSDDSPVSDRATNNIYISPTISAAVPSVNQQFLSPTNTGLQQNQFNQQQQQQPALSMQSVVQQPVGQQLANPQNQFAQLQQQQQPSQQNFVNQQQQQLHVGLPVPANFNPAAAAMLYGASTNANSMPQALPQQQQNPQQPQQNQLPSGWSPVVTSTPYFNAQQQQQQQQARGVGFPLTVLPGGATASAAGNLYSQQTNNLPYAQNQLPPDLQQQQNAAIQQQQQFLAQQQQQQQQQQVAMVTQGQQPLQPGQVNPTGLLQQNTAASQQQQPQQQQSQQQQQQQPQQQSLGFAPSSVIQHAKAPEEPTRGTAAANAMLGTDLASSLKIDRSKLGPDLQQYLFDNNDVYDVRRFLQQTVAGCQVLERFRPETHAAQFVSVRKQLIRMCSMWLMEIAERRNDPTKIERARMAFSIIYAFPFYASISDGLLGYEHIYNPVSHRGYLSSCIANRRSRIVNRFPEMLSKYGKRRRTAHAIAAYTAAGNQFTAAAGAIPYRRGRKASSLSFGAAASFAGANGSDPKLEPSDSDTSGGGNKAGCSSADEHLDDDDGEEYGASHDAMILARAQLNNQNNCSAAASSDPPATPAAFSHAGAVATNLPMTRSRASKVYNSQHGANNNISNNNANPNNNSSAEMFPHCSTNGSFAGNAEASGNYTTSQHNSGPNHPGIHNGIAPSTSLANQQLNAGY